MPRTPTSSTLRSPRPARTFRTSVVEENGTATTLVERDSTFSPPSASLALLIGACCLLAALLTASQPWPTASKGDHATRSGDALSQADDGEGGEATSPTLPSLSTTPGATGAGDDPATAGSAGGGTSTGISSTTPKGTGAVAGSDDLRPISIAIEAPNEIVSDLRPSHFTLHVRATRGQITSFQAIGPGLDVSRTDELDCDDDQPSSPLHLPLSVEVVPPAYGAYQVTIRATVSECIGSIVVPTTVTQTVPIGAVPLSNGPAPVAIRPGMTSEPAFVARDLWEVWAIPHTWDLDGWVNQLRIDWGDQSPLQIIDRSVDGCRDPRAYHPINPGAPDSWSGLAYFNWPVHRFTPGTYTVTVTAVSVGCDGGNEQETSRQEVLQFTGRSASTTTSGAPAGDPAAALGAGSVISSHGAGGR